MQKHDQEVEAQPLSVHILPTSCTMIGVCTTLIGLVKVAHSVIGPSLVDKYTAISLLIFLLSALLSYFAIRKAQRPAFSARLELLADRVFITGLVSLGVIVAFFAYEII